MKIISVAWLEEKNACSDAVKEFSAQPETDAVKIIRQMTNCRYHLNWANWLIVRIMTRPQYLAYGIYSAEQVIDIFEKKYPDEKRLRNAIEAAKMVLENDTKKNRAAAKKAAGIAWTAGAAGAIAWAAGDVAYAAGAAGDVAWAAGNAGAAAWAAAGDATQIKILRYGLSLIDRADDKLRR